MASREQEAWETVEAFFGYADISDDMSQQYFGSELYQHSVSIQSITLPPPPEDKNSPNIPVTVVIRCRIPENFNNRVGNLHGGGAATVFDNFNSSVILVWASHCSPSEEMTMRWITTGVSRTLNVSYVRPMPVGEEVDVENQLVSVGKNMAFVRSTMTRVKDGKIVCTAEHHKATTFESGRL